MKIIDRLAAYIEYKGMSLNSFDKSICAANGYIGKQIKNQASIGVDMIERIVSIYRDLSVEWLITGMGNMIKGDNGYPNPDEKDPPGNLVAEKERTILSQKETIETQKYLNTLLREENEYLKRRIEENRTADSGQKRKAG